MMHYTFFFIVTLKKRRAKLKDKQNLQNIITSLSQETTPPPRGSFNHTAFKLSVALLRIFQISSAAHIAIGVRSIKVGRYAHASPTPHHKWLEGRSAGFITQPSWPTTKKKPIASVRGLQL